MFTTSQMSSRTRTTKCLTAVMGVVLVGMMSWLVYWSPKEGATFVVGGGSVRHVQKWKLSGPPPTNDIYDAQSNFGGCHPFCPHRKARKFTYSKTKTTPRPWRDVADVTSEKFTRYTIVNRKPIYRVCDEFELRIVARNGRNESKGFGGDYFRVKIFTMNTTFSAGSTSDGDIVDHCNGTYSVYFTLKWTGKVRVNVTLIHTSEAVYVLNEIRNNRHPVFNYSGLFISPTNASIREEVSCNFVPIDKAENLCNFTDRGSGVPWYCQKPRGLSCRDWKMHRRDLIQMIDGARAARNNTEKKAFKISDQVILGPVTEIIVHSQMIGDIHEAIASLPECDPNSHRNKPDVAGFYMNGVWFSPYCNVQKLSSEETKKCMANKQLHFYGDSTVRQLHQHVYKTIPLETYFEHLLAGESWTSRVNGSDVTNNIKTHFEFHYLPIHHNQWMDLGDVRPFQKYIDNIDSKEHVTITVSLWAHFTHVSESMYRQRIQMVVDAAEKLYKRNPRALVILKGANTRYHEDITRYLIGSDWYSKELNTVMKEVIALHPNIGFLDTWDMSNAQLAPDRIHPLAPHAKNMLRQVLSMICHKRTALKSRHTVS